MADGFTCKVDGQYLSACKVSRGEDLPEYKDGYCVLHYPGYVPTQDVEAHEFAKFEKTLEEKREEFEKVRASKLDCGDYDFSGTIFAEGTSAFKDFEFDAQTNFAGAKFIGDVNFSGAKFSAEDTNFSAAQFSSEWIYFEEAQFSSKQTYFLGAQFYGKQTRFWRAQFAGFVTHFSTAQFHSKLTNFAHAQFHSSSTTAFTGVEFRSEETFFMEATFLAGWWTLPELPSRREFPSGERKQRREELSGWERD